MTRLQKPTLRRTSASVPDYVLRVELMHFEPVIWRRIVVPGSIRLSRLHDALQSVMGWSDGHLHEFMFAGIHYGEPDDYSDPPTLNESRVTLDKALGRLRSFTYLYDFGDSWWHKIKVEKRTAPYPDLDCPLCLDGENACPPEDVGGVSGYSWFLEAIQDPSNDEHDHLLAWCGGAFDPAAFDVNLTNQSLSGIRFRRSR